MNMTIRSAVVIAALGSAAPAFAQAQAVDPVARAEAAQALAAANSPKITKTTVVATDIAGTPAVADPNGTVGNMLVQVNAADPNVAGYLGFKYGADGKGVTNFWVKTRGAKMNTFDAVQAGDRVVTDLWQAGTGSQTGHVGGTRVIVDANPTNSGEVAGRWVLFTDTGVHISQASPQYPNRFGPISAIVANSFQQVLFPGGLGGLLPPPGANFGGWVVIGAGANSPGFSPLKFLTSNAHLLAVPEPGAFEVDAGAAPYFTKADGVRRSFVLADTAAPTVKVLAAAGSGASVKIDAQGNSGMITLTTGSAPTSGDQFSVTYAHAYSTASYPVIAAANAAGVNAVRNGFLEATPAGFVLDVPGGLAPNTAYAITFNAPGK
jgi:hypothetical protein